MKAIKRCKNNYDLKGTDLMFIGENDIQGSHLEQFKAKKLLVLRSIEKENGKDRLTISFSSYPTNTAIPEDIAVSYAERLGLDKNRPYDITSHPCIFNGVQIITYIFQDCLPASRIYS